MYIIFSYVFIFFLQKGMPKRLKEFVVKNPEDSPVYKKFFKDFPNSFTHEEKINIEKNAKSAIIKHVNIRKNQWFHGSKLNINYVNISLFININHIRYCRVSDVSSFQSSQKFFGRRI